MEGPVGFHRIRPALPYALKRIRPASAWPASDVHASRALERAPLVFAQTDPNAVVLIGVERAFQTRVNHLAGTANGLGFFDLLIGGTGVADPGKTVPDPLSRHAALARQSKALLM